MQTIRRGSSDQWAILAALRFFLAACVFAGHFAILVHHDPHHILGDGYLNPGSAVFGFFILSGFSIAASLEEGRDGFYRRRFIRIWPLYLATIAFGIFVALYIGNDFKFPYGQGLPPPTGINILASLLMLQNIVAPPILVIGQIWSLSPEWWHYMVAPAFKKMSDMALGVFIALSFLAMLLIKIPPGHGAESLPHGLGILYLSWFWVSGFLYWRYAGTPIGFAIIGFPPILALTLNQFIGAPMLLSVFALVLSSEIRIRPSLARFFVFLGDVSYPLYLLHLPAIVLALALGASYDLITLLGAVGVSVLAVYVIDYPSRKILRKWLFPARAEIAAIPPESHLRALAGDTAVK